MRALIAFALLTAAMPATARDAPLADRQAALAKDLAGRVPDKPMSCIQQHPWLRSHVVEGQAIIYEDGGRWYVNDFHGQGCRPLRKDRATSTRTPSGSLCSGDAIQVFDAATHINYGPCIFGEFTPYRRAAR